ncbi:MAG: hypothetical protein KY443_06600 [Actinobacteria bacterium]|nr:hypothetical protein [Actinomycetota bacterium]
MDAAGLRPLGIGEMLDVAIKLYRRRFGTLVRAVAVVIGPIYGLLVIVQLSLIPTQDDIAAIESTDPVTGMPEFDWGILWAFVAGALVFGLAYFLASQLATAASFRVVSAGYLGEDVEWRDSLRFAVGRLRSLVWLSFLLAVFIGVGFLLCIVPGVYLFGAYAVAVPVLLLEELRGRAAMKRSRALVSGRWWPVVAVIFLGMLLAQIVSSVLTGIFTIPLGSADNEVASILGNAVGSTLSAVVVTPFTAAVTTVVYFDLRVRKEGFDLELLAREVGVAPAERAMFFPPPAPPPPPSGAQPPFWPPPPGWRPPDA